MPAVRTIETDPTSPFGEPEIPPAEWTYRHCSLEAFKRGPSYAVAWLRSCGVDHLPDFPKARSLERTVVAYVNHGRWLWDCPNCGAAQCCTPNDPRAFCVGCFNRADGWWPVVFPDEPTMSDGVLLLERRARAEQQNWQPTAETVDQLALENLSLGVDPDTPHRIIPGARDALPLVCSVRGLDADRLSVLELD